MITREYPQAYVPGHEPYYPVNGERDDHLYHQYDELAQAEPHTIFGGRLATYRYMNMDEVMASAMRKWENERMKMLLRQQINKSRTLTD